MLLYFCFSSFAIVKYLVLSASESCFHIIPESIQILELTALRSVSFIYFSFSDSRTSAKYIKYAVNGRLGFGVGNVPDVIAVLYNVLKFIAYASFKF